MSLTGDVAGVVSGIINNGQSIPTPNLTQLFQTIQSAGANQKSMIDQLPAELKPLYDQYIASTTQAGQSLQTGTNAVGQGLMSGTQANYSPDVAKAAEDAAKTAIYADLPGQQDAIREALAASGGFDRGTASKQLAAPVIQAGAKYAQSVENITAQQLQAKQQATQQAMNTIASMNDQALQSVFGMTKEQATQILTGNRQDLKDQLTALVNQSNTETNQTLGVEGANAMNQYGQQVAQNAQSTALTNGIVKLGADTASAAPGFLSGLDINSPNGSAAPANYNPPMAPNQAAILGY